MFWRQEKDPDTYASKSQTERRLCSNSIFRKPCWSPIPSLFLLSQIPVAKTDSATYWGEQELCNRQSRDCILSFSSFISYDLSLLKGKKRGKYSMVFTEVNLMYVSSVMEFYIYLNNLTLQVQKLRYKKVM